MLTARSTRGDPANVSALAFGSHTGTHVDAPRHFIAGGSPVDRIPLDRLIGPAAVLDLAGELAAVGAADLEAPRPAWAPRVLLRTRNSGCRAAGAGFTRDYCALAPDGAEYLSSRGVVLVGIDCALDRGFGSEDFPVHHLLLGRGVVIVEGLDLSSMSAGSTSSYCLPLRLAGAGWRAGEWYWCSETSGERGRRWLRCGRNSGWSAWAASAADWRSRRWRRE